MIKPPTPTPGLQPDVPETAPDFTLDRADGGSFTLQEQLEEGPVVLVFFERCG
jgi:peroxiredoxin